MSNIMDNTRNDVTAAPSAAKSTTQSSNRLSEAESLATSFFGDDDTADTSEFNSEFETAEDEHLTAEDDVEDENSGSEDESANSDQDDSEDEEVAPSEEKEEKAASRAEKRIRTVVAQKKELEQKLKAQTLQFNRQAEAMKVQMELMEHLARKANVTEADIDLINKHIEQRISSSENEIVERTEKEYADLEAKQAFAEKKQEVISSMKEAHSEWSDVFSLQQLATYMHENKVRDPAAAAKALGKKVMLAVQARTKAPSALPNAAPHPAGARRLPARESWHSANDLLELYETSSRKNSGRN